MDKLLDFCSTDNEVNAVKAYLKKGSFNGAAKLLNKDRTTVKRQVNRVKDRAALQGYAPESDMTKVAPYTHFVKGTSTLYDDLGKPRLQWVKTDKKAEDQYKVMQAAIEALKESVKPKKTYPAKSKEQSNEDLLNLYVITAYHLGMYAWGEETGNEDWNIEKAESLLVNWFKQAIKQSPDAETAILANIADLLHYDGLEAVTPQHKHILDADTRFQNVVRVAIKVLTKVVDMLLEKHEYVHIIHAQGNHDLASSAWLRELFSHFYSLNDRVTVETSPDVYYAYEFGNNSLFFHHGHRKGVGSVADVFAAKFRDMFGRTKYSYAHLGHRHSKDVKENNLMIVEQHQTLAATDAYAAHGGWISQRSAQVITYHTEYGEVGRLRITPEMC